MSDPGMLYSWRCDDCGEHERTYSFGSAHEGADYHRKVTTHQAITIVGPEGETPV